MAMHQSVCGCDRHDCPAEGGGFYVTVRNTSGAYRALLGPFQSHETALAYVQRGIDLAYKADPRAPWYSYGTARIEGAVSPLFPSED